jgi:hypothetical protein
MSETPPMPEPVEDEWFYHVGGNKFGPVSSESIIANLKRGELNSATKVWRQGMDAWTAIGATPEFGAICSQVPAVNASHLPPEPPQTPTVPSQITYDTTTDTFSGSIQAILRLAAKAITACKYKIDNANETLALITFQTGVTWGSWSGVSCSIAFEEVGSHAYKANCSGKQNLRGGQLLAINLGGEAKGKALKVVRKMIELL